MGNTNSKNLDNKKVSSNRNGYPPLHHKRRPSKRSNRNLNTIRQNTRQSQGQRQSQRQSQRQPQRQSQGQRYSNIPNNRQSTRQYKRQPQLQQKQSIENIFGYNQSNQQSNQQTFHNYNNVTYEESLNSNYSPMDRNLQVSDLSNPYQDNRIIDQSREQYKDNLIQNSFQNNIQQSVNDQQQQLYQETYNINNDSYSTSSSSSAESSHSVNDPYDILQLDRNADVNQLKKAYLRLARVYHPDRGGSPALFNIIEQAY